MRRPIRATKSTFWTRNYDTLLWQLDTPVGIANQVWPHRSSIVFFKVTWNRQNFHPGETYPYGMHQHVHDIGYPGVHLFSFINYKKRIKWRYEIALFLCYSEQTFFQNRALRNTKITFFIFAIPSNRRNPYCSKLVFANAQIFFLKMHSKLQKMRLELQKNALRITQCSE